MTETQTVNRAWWAKGLLFENCNCQVVCPGHVHFDQLCTHERCLGYWGIRFDEGRYGDVELGGLKAVVAYDSPRHMIDGHWVEVILIDEQATAEQRRAVEAILEGSAGGPWEVLGRFVGQRLETRFVPIEIQEEAGGSKRISVPGILESTVRWLKGKDRSRPVTFQNMFNQIHPPTMVIGQGTTAYDDGTIVVNNQDTHGLHSNFEWSVNPE